MRDSRALPEYCNKLLEPLESERLRSRKAEQLKFRVKRRGGVLFLS
jgi:hypothetical protein